MTRASTLLSIVLVLVAGPLAADEGAQSPAELIKKGVAAVESKQFDEALRLFRLAVVQDPKPEYLCNIGMAYYSLNQFARAERYLSQCSREVASPDPDVLKVLSFVVEKLEAGEYSKVRVSSEPSADVVIDFYGDDPPLTTPTTVFLPHGRYTAELGRGETTQSIKIDAREPEVVVNVSLVEVPTQKDDVRPAEKGMLGWVIMGVGVALAGGGGVAHYLALDSRDKAAAATEESDYDEHAGDVRTREVIAWSLYGAGAVGIGVGLFLQLRGSDAIDSPQLAVQPTNGGGMFTWTWSQ